MLQKDLKKKKLIEVVSDLRAGMPGELMAVVIQAYVVQGQGLTACSGQAPVWVGFHSAYSKQGSGFIQSPQRSQISASNGLCFLLGQRDFDLADALDHPGRCPYFPMVFRSSNKF